MSQMSLTTYTAPVIVGQEVWGGIAYFHLYAVLGAALCGAGLSLYWMVVVRRLSISDLGLTIWRLWLSLALQMAFSVLLFIPTLVKYGLTLPLAAAIGLVEVLILMFILVWLAARYQKELHLPEIGLLNLKTEEKQ
jgi:hypothetical protein